jgi:riboflavin biosynthesis pyrimidine reductase
LSDQAEIDPLLAVEVLRARGHELILCEGGPTLFAAFVAAGLVDELFLTLSPTLIGRPTGERRLSLLEQLAPASGTTGTLLSLRRNDSHLFLRYRLPQGAGLE